MASKVKMSGSEKESEQEHKQQLFGVRTYTVSSVKHVNRKSDVVVVQTTAKECTKKCAARVKLFSLLIRPIVVFVVVLFFAVLNAVTEYSITRFYFCVSKL